ncbi:MAG: ferredoxin [Prevotellaceae bacterium]|jgi:electron transport complex protein RnfB|nr:ferredoxin [Prevotellaceae bacterium]
MDNNESDTRSRQSKPEHKGSPMARRKFLHVLGATLAGGTLLGMGGVLGSRAGGPSGDTYWQVDPQKCIQCGRCETHCVLPVSAVKCIHANRVCGYCDLCGGYYRSNAKELNTAAENLMCPTGAIARKYVEDPYFEYTIDESLCNGCAKCVKGCGSFGNGSLYLQIKRDLCKDCNECRIAAACPADAISRRPLKQAYLLKE